MVKDAAINIGVQLFGVDARFQLPGVNTKKYEP